MKKKSSIRAEIGLLRKKLDSSLDEHKEKSAKTDIDFNPDKLKEQDTSSYQSANLRRALGSLSQTQKLLADDPSNAELLKRQESLLKSHAMIMSNQDKSTNSKKRQVKSGPNSNDIGKKLLKAPAKTSAKSASGIKHLNPKLAKEKQKHINDFMHLNLPSIQENTNHHTESDQSKVFDYEIENSESELGISKSHHKSKELSSVIKRPKSKADHISKRNLDDQESDVIKDSVLDKTGSVKEVPAGAFMTDVIIEKEANETPNENHHQSSAEVSISDSLEIERDSITKLSTGQSAGDVREGGIGDGDGQHIKSLRYPESLREKDTEFQAITPNLFKNKAGGKHDVLRDSLDTQFATISIDQSERQKKPAARGLSGSFKNIFSERAEHARSGHIKPVRVIDIIKKDAQPARSELSLTSLDPKVGQMLKKHELTPEHWKNFIEDKKQQLNTGAGLLLQRSESAAMKLNESLEAKKFDQEYERFQVRQTNEHPLDSLELELSKFNSKGSKNSKQSAHVRSQSRNDGPSTNPTSRQIEKVSIDTATRVLSSSSILSADNQAQGGNQEQNEPVLSRNKSEATHPACNDSSDSKSQSPTTPGSYRPKSAFSNKHLFPQGSDNLYSPVVHRPISAIHKASNNQKAQISANITTTGPHLSSLSQTHESLAITSIDNHSYASTIPQTFKKSAISVLQRQSSLHSQTPSGGYDELSQYRDSLTDLSVNWPQNSIDKNYFPSLTSLTIASNSLTNSQILDNHSFLKDSLEYSTMRVESSVGNGLRQTTIRRPYTASNSTKPHLDPVRGLNESQLPKKETHSSSQKEHKALASGELDDSLNRFVGSFRKMENSNSRKQMDSFYLDDVMTLRSGYTITTNGGQIRSAGNMSELMDDSFNKRDSIEGSRVVSSTDQTLNSEYTVSRQETTRSRASAFTSYHANNSLSQTLAELVYKNEVKKISFLGGGSEAKVYLVKLPGGEDLAALKQYEIAKNQTKHIEAYNNLHKEFNMLRKLEHPNIIQYFCLYKPKHGSYNNCFEYGILMEYMSGGPLERYIQQNFAKVTASDKKSFIKQILSGLDYLHQNNIIHRDLKPANLLVSSDRKTVKISDFGISTQTEGNDSVQRTLVGTPWYMAPEVINQEPYSIKADVWSAGCCIYHIMTGRKPYDQANAIQALMMMVHHKSPLESCDEGTKSLISSEPGLWDFLSLCLNREKSQRATASELLNHHFLRDVTLSQAGILDELKR